MAVQQVLQEVSGNTVHHGGVDAVRSDGVDGDVFTGTFFGEGFGQTDDGTLGSTVVYLTSIAVGYHGRQIHNASVVPIAHALDHSLAAVIGTIQIDFQNRIPLLETHLMEHDVTSKESLEMCFDLFPKLYERRNQFAGTLSGGEQQMVAVSRAIMSHPEIIMFDEPSLGLAPVVVEDVFENIMKLHEMGRTILLVEQNVMLSLEVADRA